jgi:hydroxymethylpyrimidine/phosphomethylpyrimidine kinase
MIKKVTLITPNIPEAEVLAGRKIYSKNDMIIAGKKLLKLGAKNVLIKGGHLKSSLSYDILLEKNKIFIYKNKKIKSKHTHGTGCTLSSAIATYYSCGKSLNKSCENAIKYVNQAISNAPKFGKGHGPINHLNSIELIKKFK